MAHLPDDHDLFNLSCSCLFFANALIPKESAIWKARFLEKYDHPDVVVQTDYSAAYRLRRFVLRSFVAFTNPDDPRLIVQLEVLRDMIIGKRSRRAISYLARDSSCYLCRGLQSTTETPFHTPDVSKPRSFRLATQLTLHPHFPFVVLLPLSRSKVRSGSSSF